MFHCFRPTVINWPKVLICGFVTPEGLFCSGYILSPPFNSPFNASKVSIPFSLLTPPQSCKFTNHIKLFPNLRCYHPVACDHPIVLLLFCTHHPRVKEHEFILHLWSVNSPSELAALFRNPDFLFTPTQPIFTSILCEPISCAFREICKLNCAVHNLQILREPNREAPVQNSGRDFLKSTFSPFIPVTHRLETG